MNDRREPLSVSSCNFGLLRGQKREDLKRAWSSFLSSSREFKQITTAGATAAAVSEKVWGEYVSVV